MAGHLKIQAVRYMEGLRLRNQWSIQSNTFNCQKECPIHGAWLAGEFTRRTVICVFNPNVLMIA
jgi:hypothetical protein